MPKYVIIGLIVVIGTFLIMNYWPKLKEQTKNRILMVIFGIFFISIFVLLFLLMFWGKLIDILSILVAGIFSCIILDILGYLLKLLGVLSHLGELLVGGPIICLKMDPLTIQI